MLKVYARCTQAPDVAQHEMYREFVIQSTLQHPNIVHLYAAFQVGQLPGAHGAGAVVGQRGCKVQTCATAPPPCAPFSSASHL